MKRFPMKRFGALFCTGAIGAVLLAGPAPAQQMAPDRTSTDLQGLVDDLNALIKRAERDRSADPRFLDDLSALTRRYEWQWPVSVLRESFRDGNYTRDPAWEVAAGDFWIDGSSLRSNVQAPLRQRDRRDNPADTAAQVLGTVLQELGRSSTPESRERTTERAEIFVNQPFSNAFAIRVNLNTRSDAGHLELGPYQTARRDIGYRLVYSPEQAPGLQLLRLIEGTGGVVEMVGRDLEINDGRDHELLWTRDREGNMAVTLDGKTMMATQDRGIQQPFQGFTIVNHGGDYAVDNIEIDGAQALSAQR